MGMVECIGLYEGIETKYEENADRYARIHNIENASFYNLPPQNQPGEYESIVREHFDSAISVHHFREILDIENFELQVLERRGILQKKLQNLMLEELNITRIMELYPFANIEKEAFHFIQYKLEPVGNPRYAFQRPGRIPLWDQLENALLGRFKKTPNSCQGNCSPLRDRCAAAVCP